MTYCVGLKLDAGMVLLSDTRTNAGVDDIACYRKMFTFSEPGERIITIMTAGSLSVTQTVISKLQEAIVSADANADTSIMLAPSMLRAAEIIGNVLSEVSADITAKMNRMDQAATASASMIVAAERRGGEQRLFRLYPEGNFIEATEDTPFLQIGEHKYGKPILDRVVRPETSLEDAQKAVLLSMDSTLRSNLSVGLPLDMMILPKGACAPSMERRIEQDDDVFRNMSDAWSEALRDSFSKISLG